VIISGRFHGQVESIFFSWCFTKWYWYCAGCWSRWSFL